MHGNALQMLRGRLEVGPHCMLANGCVITDGDHRFDDLETPVP